MLEIPFLSRLHLTGYFSLAISLLAVLLEHLIYVITLLLPSPIINFCYRVTRRLFNYLSSPSSRRNREKRKGVWSGIANASDFVELCELYGYYAEEHIVQTRDGYLLGLHRLGWRRGEEDMKVNVSGGVKKKVVYLHHGLLMNSEVWVCLTERERCLPFALVERGYDVWLGNNRGNKYSKKCVHCAPTSTAFWNFSMDQFAFHDIPDSIDYILATTNQPSLSYIGFSQGTAQAFATLSIHPTLNDKVDVFIALAPAMSPKGLTSSFVDSLIKASPDVLFLAFGRRAILGSTPMWQSILYPPIFVRVIDTALKFLFGWTGVNISQTQKLASYPHLYSYTSTKSVVHWFQIIRNGVFQMYDDEEPNVVTMNREKYYKVAKFPTRNIRTPIVLVYGGSDSLVDIEVMLKELPRHTIAKEIPHYEHLDFLWAASVQDLVFPHVFDALGEYARGEPEMWGGTGEKMRRRVRSASSPSMREVGSYAAALTKGRKDPREPSTTFDRRSLKASNRVSRGIGEGTMSSETVEKSPEFVSRGIGEVTMSSEIAQRSPEFVSRGIGEGTMSSEIIASQPDTMAKGIGEGTMSSEQRTQQKSPIGIGESTMSSDQQSQQNSPLGIGQGTMSSEFEARSSEPVSRGLGEGTMSSDVGPQKTPEIVSRGIGDGTMSSQAVYKESASVNGSQLTGRSSTTRPEGWWSSDEVAGTGESDVGASGEEEEVDQGDRDGGGNGDKKEEGKEKEE